MNARDTTEQTEKADLQTIEHKIESSPEFEGDVDPITLLETLDDHIETLANKTDENTVQQVQNELQSMEIITMDHGDKSWWISEPVLLHKYKMQRPLSKRISHLLKTKGEWKTRNVHKDTLEVKSRTRLPLGVAIQSETESKMISGRIRTLLFSIMDLHRTIEDKLENGKTSSIGVFQRPNGIIHMNKLKIWLEDNERYGAWGMKNELSTISLYDIVNAATITTSP